jgi:hypothetical protein
VAAEAAEVAGAAVEEEAAEEEEAAGEEAEEEEAAAAGEEAEVGVAAEEAVAVPNRRFGAPGAGRCRCWNGPRWSPS